MCGGIGQGVDDLHLLDDRSGPSVRDDKRQRVLVLGTDVDEMNVQSVDLGDELRIGIQLRLDLAPVVVGRPITGERLDGGELNALRVIRDRFPLGPTGRVDAPAQLGKVRFRKIHSKWADRSLVGCYVRAWCRNRFVHGGSLRVCPGLGVLKRGECEPNGGQERRHRIRKQDAPGRRQAHTVSILQKANASPSKRFGGLATLTVRRGLRLGLGDRLWRDCSH